MFTAKNNSRQLRADEYRVWAHGESAIARSKARAEALAQEAQFWASDVTIELGTDGQLEDARAKTIAAAAAANGAHYAAIDADLRDDPDVSAYWAESKRANGEALMASERWNQLMDDLGK